MIDIISPLEKLFHNLLDSNFLKVFQGACYPCLRPYRSNKHDFAPFDVFFLVTVYTTMDIGALNSKWNVFISQEMFFLHFYEHVFPLTGSSSTHSSNP